MICERFILELWYLLSTVILEIKNKIHISFKSFVSKESKSMGIEKNHRVR